MGKDPGAEQGAIVENQPLLISARAASRWLGVDNKTFAGIAAAQRLTPVSTGRTWLWRRAEVERLAGLPVEGEPEC